MSPQDLTLPVIRVADPELGLELYKRVDTLAAAIDAAPSTHHFVDAEGRVLHGRADNGNGDAAAAPAASNGNMLARIRASVDHVGASLDDDEKVAAMVPASAIAAVFRPQIGQRLGAIRGAENTAEAAQHMDGTGDGIPWCKIFGKC